MNTKNAPPNNYHTYSSKINAAIICVSFVCSVANYYSHSAFLGLPDALRIQTYQDGSGISLPTI